MDVTSSPDKICPIHVSPFQFKRIADSLTKIKNYAHASGFFAGVASCCALKGGIAYSEAFASYDYVTTMGLFCGAFMVGSAVCAKKAGVQENVFLQACEKSTSPQQVFTSSQFNFMTKQLKSLNRHAKMGWFLNGLSTFTFTETHKAIMDPLSTIPTTFGTIGTTALGAISALSFATGFYCLCKEPGKMRLLKKHFVP